MFLWGSTPALVQNKTGSISNLSFLGSPLTNLNLFELSNEQVLTLLDMAVNSFTSDGGSLDSNEFLNRLKSDPVYKKDFIQDIQSTYKKEVQYQIEKWRPSH